MCDFHCTRLSVQTVRRALEEADAARQQAGKAERLRRQQQHEHELLKAR